MIKAMQVTNNVWARRTPAAGGPSTRPTSVRARHHGRHALAVASNQPLQPGGPPRRAHAHTRLRAGGSRSSSRRRNFQASGYVSATDVLKSYDNGIAAVNSFPVIDRFLMRSPRLRALGVSQSLIDDLAAQPRPCGPTPTGHWPRTRPVTRPRAAATSSAANDGWRSRRSSRALERCRRRRAPRAACRRTRRRRSSPSHSGQHTLVHASRHACERFAGRAGEAGERQVDALAGRLGAVSAGGCVRVDEAGAGRGSRGAPPRRPSCAHATSPVVVVNKDETVPSATRAGRARSLRSRTARMDQSASKRACMTNQRILNAFVTAVLFGGVVFDVSACGLGYGGEEAEIDAVNDGAAGAHRGRRSPASTATSSSPRASVTGVASARASGALGGGPVGAAIGGGVGVGIGSRGCARSRVRERDV